MALSVPLLTIHRMMMFFFMVMVMIMAFTAMFPVAYSCSVIMWMIR